MLANGESVMSITNFPRLGCENFTFPVFQPRPDDPNSSNRSCYFPDEAIFPGHPRFKTLTRNIRMRRGEKVSINLKVFRDKNTILPVAGSPAGQPDVVHMDAMGFGMGCCCLQLTFQACNIDEARSLYDQLTPLCPIMLALTAASPAFRGYLTESDCRWNVISASVDCRTEEERGLKPLRENQFEIAKSRYDSIDSYLSPAGEKYNDVPLTYDEKVYQRLREGNIDHLLAQHVAHLFIRDTVSLFEEKVHQNDAEDTDHFENIQSTNWQTMRFKPPPPNSPIGWRVEFRPCEIQMTDFENAAIVCFVVLLTRVILSYNLDFLIPISKVDENMQRAQRRDALRQEKFWFKKRPTQKQAHDHLVEEMQKKENGVAGGGDTGERVTTNGNASEDEDEYELMTVDEIINGKKDASFPGLIPLIHSYLGSMDVDADTHCTIQQYLRLIQKRASGELLTTASWIRNEIVTHPDYKFDSIVTEQINFDLLKKAHEIQEGQLPCPQLLGTCTNSKTTDTIPPAIQKHLSQPAACL